MFGMGCGREWKPYEFWEYTTIVMDRFFEIDPDWREPGNSVRSLLREFEKDLLTRFNEARIKCSPDNKIAFGLKHETLGTMVYIGFYDGKMIIGLSVRSDSWNKPHRAE